MKGPIDSNKGAWSEAGGVGVVGRPAGNGFGVSGLAVVEIDSNVNLLLELDGSLSRDNFSPVNVKISVPLGNVDDIPNYEEKYARERSDT